MKKLPVKITGPVLHGNALGRKIDMPTANIEPDENIDGLEYGVYYSKIHIGNNTYKGISNLGKKPTVQDDGKVNLESFIYDFDGEIYDKEITVELLEFRRGEKKFSSFEELSKEMHKDLEAGRNYN